MAGKFEIYTDKGGSFRFRLKAGNGETLLASEGYAARANAVNGIESVRKNASDRARFDASETKSGKFRFNLKAANHQVIATSQNYATEASRDNGIAAVGRAADGAKFEDTTK